METFWIFLILFAGAIFCLLLALKLSRSIEDLRKRLSAVEVELRAFRARRESSGATRPKSVTPILAEVLEEEREGQTTAGADTSPELQQPPPSSPVTKPKSDAPPYHKPATTILPTEVAPLVQLPARDERPQKRWREIDWEAMIGGNWLNKLGALLIVIGLAIFLGYSLTQFGPLGKVITGHAVGLSMLVVGILLQRWEKYSVFASGLVGGGWSALYFTTYAMHAVEAAKVISNPFLAASLLCLIPAAMIAHAIWKRSAIGATLAYVMSTLTLTLTPPFVLPAIVLVPMLVAVLYISYQFEWENTGAVAIIATYGFFIWSFADGGLSQAYVTGLILLACYWMLFECYDILLDIRAAKGVQLDSARQLCLPLNTFGSLAALYATWTHQLDGLTSVIFAVVAGLFLLNSIARGGAHSADEPVDYSPLQSAWMGGYESAITVSVAAMTLALTQKFSGLTLTFTLFCVAEPLILYALRLKRSYLRLLGLTWFVATSVILLRQLTGLGETIAMGGLTLSSATPLATLAMVTAYVNRELIRNITSASWLRFEVIYGFAATAFGVSILIIELPEAALGLALLVFGFILLQVGLTKRLWDLRIEGYLAGGLGIIVTILVNGFTDSASELAVSYWAWLGPVAILLGALATQMIRLDDELIEREARVIEHCSLSAALLATCLLIWHALPTPVVVLGWSALALSVYELGRRLQLPAIRGYGYSVALVSGARLFLANFVNPGQTLEISHRVLSVAPVIAMFYYMGIVSQAKATLGKIGQWEISVRKVFPWLGTLLTVVLLRFELGRVLAVVGWLPLMLLLFAIGLFTKRIEWRWQSYAVAVLIFARSWSTNFFIPESLTGSFGRVMIGCLVVSGFFAAQMLAHFVARSRGELSDDLRISLNDIDRHARSFFALLGGFLAAVLILYEVSGRVLTIAWAFEGAGLLILGLMLHDRIVRLSGLALLALCTFKVFLYDFASLATPYRIASFVMLGVLLVLVSWFYTLYRKRLTKLSHP